MHAAQNARCHAKQLALVHHVANPCCSSRKTIGPEYIVGAVCRSCNYTCRQSATYCHPCAFNIGMTGLPVGHKAGTHAQHTGTLNFGSCGHPDVLMPTRRTQEQRNNKLNVMACFKPRGCMARFQHIDLIRTPQHATCTLPLVAEQAKPSPGKEARHNCSKTYRCQQACTRSICQWY
jgi:hypothetical protein